MKQTSIAWVFVSHSNSDLAKVRHVRDALEKSGAQPVLFFLKCLSDHDEIDDLIKREIEARTFFLLCDSSNARNSKWVQDEIAHVKTLKGRKIEIIDLESDWNTQLTGIANIVRGATAFLSYSHSDLPDVQSVREALIARDFGTWDAEHDLSVGEPWAERIESAIEDAALSGYFLHFISRDSIRSRWVTSESERAMALEMGSRYIPILLDPVSMLEDLMPPFIRERQCIDFSDKDLERILPQLLRALNLKDTESV